MQVVYCVQQIEDEMRSLISSCVARALLCSRQFHAMSKDGSRLGFAGSAPRVFVMLLVVGRQHRGAVDSVLEVRFWIRSLGSFGTGETYSFTISRHQSKNKMCTVQGSSWLRTA